MHHHHDHHTSKAGIFLNALFEYINLVPNKVTWDTDIMEVHIEAKA